MCVGNQNVRDGLPRECVDDCLDVIRISRTRIDNRNFPRPENIRSRTMKRERAWIVRDNPSNSRSNLGDLTVAKIEFAPERNFHTHLFTTCFIDSCKTGAKDRMHLE